MKESCLAANLRETVTQRFPVQAPGAVGGKRRRRCFCDCTISA